MFEQYYASFASAHRALAGIRWYDSVVLSAPVSVSVDEDVEEICHVFVNDVHVGNVYVGSRDWELCRLFNFNGEVI